MLRYCLLFTLILGGCSTPPPVNDHNIVVINTALNEYESALKNHPKSTAQKASQVALTYKTYGDYVSAYDFYLKAAQHRNQNDSTLLSSKIFNVLELSEVQLLRGELESAHDYLSSLDTARFIETSHSIDFLKLNWSIYYLEIGQPQMAKEQLSPIFLKMLELYRFDWHNIQNIKLTKSFIDYALDPQKNSREKIQKQIEIIKSEPGNNSKFSNGYEDRFKRILKLYSE